MKNVMAMLAGGLLVAVLVFLGCSKNIQNSMEPEKNITEQPGALSKNDPASSEVDKPQLNPTRSSTKYPKNEERKLTELREKSRYNMSKQMGQILCWGYGHIYDETRVGGLPSLSFLAGSMTTDILGNPVSIESILVEAQAFWHPLNSTEWEPLWYAQAIEFDWWIVEVSSPVFEWRDAWTGGLQGYHRFKDGIRLVAFYGPFIQRTAYWKENKMPG